MLFENEWHNDTYLCIYIRTYIYVVRLPTLYAETNIVHDLLESDILVPAADVCATFPYYSNSVKYFISLFLICARVKYRVTFTEMLRYCSMKVLLPFSEHSADVIWKIFCLVATHIIPRISNKFNIGSF